MVNNGTPATHATSYKQHTHNNITRHDTHTTQRHEAIMTCGLLTLFCVVCRYCRTCTWRHATTMHGYAKPNAITCTVCHKHGGAMIRTQWDSTTSTAHASVTATSKQAWIHVVCALFLPEMYFPNEGAQDALEPVSANACVGVAHVHMTLCKAIGWEHDSHLLCMCVWMSRYAAPSTKHDTN